MAHSRTAAVLLVVGLSLTACGGSTGGEEGPVVVGSNTPVSGSAPRLGSATVGDLGLSGFVLHGDGSALTVAGQIRNSGSEADQVVSMGSNYTETRTLAPPLQIPPGGTVTVDAPTVQLPLVGQIDPQATVGLNVGFARAGTVEVFATYSP